MSNKRKVKVKKEKGKLSTGEMFEGITVALTEYLEKEEAWDEGDLNVIASQAELLLLLAKKFDDAVSMDNGIVMFLKACGLAQKRLVDELMAARKASCKCNKDQEDV